MKKKDPLKLNNPDAHYRQLLIEKRASVLSALGTKAQALSRGDRVSDEDQAQYSLDEAVSLRLNGFEYLQLRHIQEALDRLQLGDFGTCLACEESIAPKRLQALPWA